VNESTPSPRAVCLPDPVPSLPLADLFLLSDPFDAPFKAGLLFRPGVFAPVAGAPVCLIVPLLLAVLLNILVLRTERGVVTIILAELMVVIPLAPAVLVLRAVRLLVSVAVRLAHMGTLALALLHLMALLALAVLVPGVPVRVLGAVVVLLGRESVAHLLLPILRLAHDDLVMTVITAHIVIVVPLAPMVVVLDAVCFLVRWAVRLVDGWAAAFFMLVVVILVRLALAPLLPPAPVHAGFAVSVWAVDADAVSDANSRAGIDAGEGQGEQGGQRLDEHLVCGVQ